MAKNKNNNPKKINEEKIQKLKRSKNGKKSEKKFLGKGEKY